MPDAHSYPGQDQLRIAVYGTLMKGFGGQESAGIEEEMKLLGPCILRGALYDLGEFPGLVTEEGIVAGELYELRGHAALLKLDKYEEFDATHPDKSLFVRRY